MGLLDGLLGQAGGLEGIAKLAAQNPQVISAITSLLSSRDSSVGGTGGLGGLVSAFQNKGMGDMISSWISTGPNPPVSAAQITDVLGSDVLKQFGQKAGVPQGESAGILASLLPQVIDKLTPDGKVPETNSFESSLDGLLSGLMK